MKTCYIALDKTLPDLLQYLTDNFRRQKTVNTNVMTIKNPFLTTVRTIKDTSGIKTAETVRKIQDKLFMYGIISEREQAFLDRYSQKDLAKMR